MQKDWLILKPDINLTQRISRILKCNLITASILANRGIKSAEQAFTFLNTSLDNLRSPFSIKDMDIAVDRISRAIENKEKILIFGDYDADGLTAIAVLMEFLNYCKANVCYYIPSRTEEGYGLKPDHITGFSKKNHIDLIITVDCGISSHDAAHAANKEGIDLIITDHHSVGSELPSAYSVINPKRTDCQSGLDHLAGVGVAFYLLIALRKSLREEGYWQNITEPNLKAMCSLVAIGTIADVVPLVAENRILSDIGIEMLRMGKNPGLNALMEISKIDISHIDSTDISFKLAPRLNSAGRISHSKIIIDLLTEKNPEKALKIAQSIDTLNIKRKEIETGIQSQIEHFLSNRNTTEKKSLILAGNNWHTGVLGIICSRLINKYHRPVILLSIKNGKGTGSGRSIPGFDLYRGLLTCSDNIEKFGGHKMAAGLTVKTENLKTFIEHFETTVSETTSEKHFIPKLKIDHQLNFSDVTENLVDELERLHPFGDGNSEPVFMADKIRIKSSFVIGNLHKRYVLYQKNGSEEKVINAIHFNGASENSRKEKFDQIAYKLKWNRWNGKKTIQIEILDVKNSSCNI